MLESENFEQIGKLKISVDGNPVENPDLMILLRIVPGSVLLPPSEMLFIICTTLNLFVMQPGIIFPPSILTVFSGLMLLAVLHFQDFEFSRRIAAELQRHPMLQSSPVAEMAFYYCGFVLVANLRRMSSFNLKKLHKRLLLSEDVPNATRSLFIGLFNLYLSGKSIPSIMKMVAEIQEIYETRYPKAVFALSILKQMRVFRLLAEDDVSFIELDMAAGALSNSARAAYSFHASWIKYVLGEFDVALTCARAALASLQPSARPPQDLAAVVLLEFLAWSRSNNVDKQEIMQEMEVRLLPMLRLLFTQASEDNFGAQFWLASAEYARLSADGPPDATISLYKRSIVFARRSSFLVLEILAQEALLHFLHDIDRPDAARNAVLELYDNYKLLGATKRLAMLISDLRYSETVISKEKEEQRELTSALFDACASGDVTRVRRLLSSAHAPHQLVASCRDVFDQSTLLHRAAASFAAGSYKVVKLLLKFRAPLNSVDRNRSTPIHLAASNGNVRALAAMLSSDTITPDQLRVLLRSRDSFGYAPFHLALRHDIAEGVDPFNANHTFETAQLLLQHGAEPTIGPDDGNQISEAVLEFLRLSSLNQQQEQ